MAWEEQIIKREASTENVRDRYKNNYLGCGLCEMNRYSTVMWVRWCLGIEVYPCELATTQDGGISAAVEFYQSWELDKR